MGAWRSCINYIGIEPNTQTFKNLNNLAEKIKYNPKMFCSGSEDFIPELEDKIDFIFTSIPYFDTEIYCNEETQSYKKYNNLDDWKIGYLKATLLNARKYLKNDKYLAINVNSNLKDILLEVSKDVFQYSHSEFIKLSTAHFNKKNKNKNMEILVFIKNI